jgi:hypothetical protein
MDQGTHSLCVAHRTSSAELHSAAAMKSVKPDLHQPALFKKSPSIFGCFPIAARCQFRVMPFDLLALSDKLLKNACANSNLIETFRLKL